MPKPTGARAAPSTLTPESAAAQTQALLEEARTLRLDMMRVLDELVHKLSAAVAAHASEGGDVNVDAVMPAVRDLAQVVTVMERLAPPRRPAPLLRRRRGAAGRPAGLAPGWYVVRTRGGPREMVTARWDGQRWWPAGS